LTDRYIFSLAKTCLVGVGDRCRLFQQRARSERPLSPPARGPYQLHQVDQLGEDKIASIIPNPRGAVIHPGSKTVTSVRTILQHKAPRHGHGTVNLRLDH
jgi:hypothetical protein